MQRKIARLALRLVGPALLAIVIVRLHDCDAIVRLLRDAEVWPLLLAVVMNLVNVYLKVVRWDVFLRARGIVYPQRRAWGAYLSSLYVGMLTPGRVGDVLRVHYLRADIGVPYAEGLASVVIDRLCDLYVLVAFVAVGVARFSSVIAGPLAWFTWGGVAATALLPLVFLIPGIAERAAGAIYRRVRAAAPDENAAGGGSFALFLTALRANVGKGLIVTIPLTVATFLVNYVQGYLLAHALHLDLTFFDVTCLLAIASLLGLLPISMSGIGVREFFFARIFPALGYSEGQGVSFGLMVFAVIYLSITALGFISWQIAPPPPARRDETGASA